jgi:cyclopropane fatty-acyl-phospholipid synthase-like methyltransferase
MVSCSPRPNNGRVGDDHLRRVASYYDRTAQLYLSALGTTCQAGLIPWFDEDPYRSTMTFVGSRAQIASGERILDAGSGFCGPSIEICRQVDGVTIDAVTISARQASVARDLVAAAGLSDRISVQVADYHRLPMDDAIFDLVMFLESSGHSHDLRKLYAEAYRLTRDGGRIYIKDLFREKQEPTVSQRKGLKTFDRLYAWATMPVTRHVKALKAAGFQQVEVAMLSGLVSMERMNDAMWEETGKGRRLSDFGKVHYREEFKDLPIVYGEIRAQKPARVIGASKTSPAAPARC